MKKSSFNTINTFNTNVEKIRRITNSLEQKGDMEQLRYIRDGLYSIVGGAVSGGKVKVKVKALFNKAAELFTALGKKKPTASAPASAVSSVSTLAPKQRSASVSTSSIPAPAPAPTVSPTPAPAVSPTPAPTVSPTPAPVQARQRSLSTQKEELIDLDHLIDCELQMDRVNYKDFEKEFIKNVLTKIYKYLNSNQDANNIYTKNIFLIGWNDYEKHKQYIDNIYNDILKDFINSNIQNFTTNKIKFSTKNNFTISSFADIEPKLKDKIDKRYKNKIVNIIQKIAWDRDKQNTVCPRIPKKK
jgi:hypothetical protein